MCIKRFSVVGFIPRLKPVGVRLANAVTGGSDEAARVEITCVEFIE